MRLAQDAIDNVNVDRTTSGCSDRFEHGRQAHVAAPTKYSICRANDQLSRAAGEGAVSQSQTIHFAMDELTHHVIMQATRHDRISDTALDVLIDGQVQTGKQLDLPYLLRAKLRQR